MSGLALAFDLEGGRPPGMAALAPLLDALAHRGVDGRKTADLGFAVLGHLHFWTTPEEAGERQPLEESGVAIAFDGRIDNRDEILAALGSPGMSKESDCRLALRAYLRFGDAAFERILGPFALAIVESLARRVTLARDPLGERTLFYAVRGATLYAASEDDALLAVPGASQELDERTAIRFLSAMPPRPGDTFFRGVRELPPGHLLRVRSGDASAEPKAYFQPWQLLPERRSRVTRPEEWVERFGQELDRSVRARLRCVGRPALMMSGGLDSGSVACLAARHLESGGGGPPIPYSWIFDELSECDERPFTAALARRWNLEIEAVSADGLWPLCEEASYLATSGRPVANVYRPLKQRLYEHVAADGHRVLLNGAAGDLLYAGALRGWLRSSLLGGRWAGAAREAMRYALHGPRRALLQGLAGCLSADQPLRRRTAQRRWPWLTAEATAILAEDDAADEERRLPARLRALAGARAATFSGEDAFTSRAGIELRDPYRDRRLVALTLALPENALFRDGTFKYVLRQALTEVLPVEVRDRRDVSTLMPLFRRGLVEHANERARRLAESDSTWRRWIRPDWLAGAWNRLEKDALESIETVVLWSVVTFGMWSRARAEGAWSLRPPAVLPARIGA